MNLYIGIILIILAFSISRLGMERYLKEQVFTGWAIFFLCGLLLDLGVICLYVHFYWPSLDQS